MTAAGNRCARRCSKRRADFADAAERLTESIEAALRESPFTFYARLLGAGGARKRILARLGPEANDALDEFLNLALTMSGARRHRSRASSRGCARQTPK